MTSTMTPGRTSRVIGLIDMDCFYVQVEQRENPTLKDKPVAVVQYNAWKGGGIIACSYESRARGVSRAMRGDDAKSVCPDIILVPVAEVRGKADLTKYRLASQEVMDVMCKFGVCVERASIDEAYLDLTEAVGEESKIATTIDSVTTVDHTTTFVAEFDASAAREWLQNTELQSFTDDNKRLYKGACLIQQIRKAIFEETGFRCSAGIAHNKVLSKLSCGLHKPNCQTILPSLSVEGLFDSLPVKKVRGLGMQLGDALNQMGINTMGELRNFTVEDLQNSFDAKTGSWLYDLSHGIENDPVISRLLPKSIGCGKNFRGKEALDTIEKVSYWVNQMTDELMERLSADKLRNNRISNLLTMSVTMEDGLHYSRAVTLHHPYKKEQMANGAINTLKQFNKEKEATGKWQPPLVNLSMAAGRFKDNVASNATLDRFLQPSSLYMENSLCSKIKQPKVLHTESHQSIKLDERKKGFFARYMESNPVIKSAPINNPKPKIGTLPPSELMKFPITDCTTKNDMVVVGSMTCSRCQKHFSPYDDMQEHMDFHFAQDVHKNLIKEDMKLSEHSIPKKIFKRGTIESFFKGK